MMADVLENLLSGQVLLDDFKVWLISDSVENCKAKADFIHYFLNYIKEKCAWLLSKDGKGLESPSIKSRSQNNPYSDINCGTGDESRASTISAELIERKKYDKRFFHSSKQGRVPEETRVKPQYANEQSKFFYNEKGYQKSQCTAKKSLNFHSVNNPKLNVHNDRRVPAFEESISNLDAFPPLGQKSNVNVRDSKVRRRITPTPVEVINKGSSKFGASKFGTPSEIISNEVFKRTPFLDNPNSNLQNERELLKIKRNNLFQPSEVSNKFNELKIENPVSPSPIKSVSLCYIIPDPEKVCHTNQLEALSSVYDILINYALVSNVTSELYFIFELLTSKISEDKCDDQNNIFCSIHNCTFFGVSVLSKLHNLLNLLDKNTLLSLCEVPFLSKFSPKLVTFLENSCKETQESITKSQSINQVPFLLEEDSRENFIASQDFTSFRKQRDLFCELLRDWPQQSLHSVDARFQENFSHKVKYLISLRPNTVNMHHLAKLFHNQMVRSCLGLDVNEVYDELLGDIQKNFPDKFEKLRQRFMMPFCVGEPNPPPSFYGIQSFFSEFIQAASSATLNQHLQDIFVCKILDFNNADIFSDGELSSLGTVKEKYFFLLHTLRLLGKFLGYLYFLPYKVSETLPANIIANQLNSRKHAIPPLDILKLLQIAVENNRVILTVPWIVEYLSMIDPVAKNLPYIEETLKILVAVYRGNYIVSPDSLNFWFLRIIIGWLFDVINYPFSYSYLLQPIVFEKNVKCEGLDFLAIIDKQLVHSCCPYLIEFKVLVHSFLNGIKNDKKREIRKITPLSTSTKPRVSTSLAKQQTEIQLEEYFFFLHAPSLRKTVEFVSERMASKVINRIRTEVTEFKLNCIKHITGQEDYKTLLNKKPINESKLKSFVDSCILELYKKSQSKIDNFIKVICREDIDQIMPRLLADDVRAPVLEMCCKISYCRAVDKIVEWCDSNLILLDIQKDIKNKLNQPPKGEGEVIVEDICASSLIESLRHLILKIQSSRCDIADDHILKLSEISPLLKRDISISARTLLLFLTVDLYVALVVCHPEKCDNECIRSFVNIWSIYPKCYSLENLNSICYSLENYFLGVQNIKFLTVGKNFEISCEKFVLMLESLINNDIFDVDKCNSSVAKLNSYSLKDSRSITILTLVSDILKSATSSAAK